MTSFLDLGAGAGGGGNFEALSSSYGYSIDAGAGLITEDGDGLLVEMTASTSFAITLTGLDPPSGAHFLLQALHLWLTIGAPVSPAAGDTFWIRSEVDATNYSEVALTYDGAAWKVTARRTVSGAHADQATALGAATINGTRIFGAQWAGYLGADVAYRAINAELYTDSANGATMTGGVRQQLVQSDGVAARTDAKTYRIGGSVGVGASWAVRIHGLRAVEHVINTPGAPF